MVLDVQQLLAQARDTITVKRVFGDPIDKDGVTVIPVAKVMGGAGGGRAPENGGSGSGGGFGVVAAPAGVFVIKGDAVIWQPALDLNRVILGGQLVAIALLLLIRAIVNARANGDHR